MSDFIEKDGPLVNGLHSRIAALEARCATLTAEVMHYTAGTPHPLEARCRELKKENTALEARCREQSGANIEFLQTWMRTANPMLGGAVPLDMMYQGMGRRVAQFIDSAFTAETACQHDCVQNCYPDQDCPKHGSSTGTAPSGEKHQDKPRPVTQYDGSLKDGDTIMDRKGNLWVVGVPAETKAEPMPVGEHPMGGPCIHVWAQTNRSAIRNGKCSICGDTVNRGVKP